MQKMIIFIGTLIILGLVWFWISFEQTESPKTTLIDPISEKLTEAPVKIKLAKPKGKMDDASFMVIQPKQEVTENNNSMTDLPPLEARRQALKELRNKGNEPLSDELITELQQQASSTQKKIDTLIAELNQNINDKDMRVKIKIKIDDLMEEYNKLVLPLALHAMAENTNS